MQCRVRYHDNVLRHSSAHNEGVHDGNRGGCSCSQGPKELVEKLATTRFPALSGVLGAVPVDKIMVYVIVVSFSEIVQDTIAVTIHNLIKEMYDWSGWHVGTGSRMVSCMAEAEWKDDHLSHHQQGDGRV